MSEGPQYYMPDKKRSTMNMLYKSQAYVLQDIIGIRIVNIKINTNYLPSKLIVLFNLYYVN